MSKSYRHSGRGCRHRCVHRCHRARHTALRHTTEMQIAGIRDVQDANVTLARLTQTSLGMLPPINTLWMPALLLNFHLCQLDST
jgi:hypothetical protein